MSHKLEEQEETEFYSKDDYIRLAKYFGIGYLLIAFGGFLFGLWQQNTYDLVAISAQYGHDIALILYLLVGFPIILWGLELFAKGTYELIMILFSLAIASRG